MGSFIGYAEVVGAILLAFGLAVGLEWVGLYGLTSLMLHRPNHPDRGANAKLKSGEGHF
jgi:hypothetical protein